MSKACLFFLFLSVYSNTVTGENRPSYKITPIERNVTARPNTGTKSVANLIHTHAVKFGLQRSHCFF